MIDKNKIEVREAKKVYPAKDYNKRRIDFTNIQVRSIDPSDLSMFVRISNSTGYTETTPIDLSKYRNKFKLVEGMYSIDASEINELKKLPVGTENIDILFERVDKKQEIDVDVYVQIS